MVVRPQIFVGSQSVDSFGVIFDSDPVNYIPGNNLRGVTVALPGAGNVNTSAEVNGVTITNPGYSGVLLHLDVTVAASTGASTLDIRIQAQDSVTNGFYDIPGASFAQLATSTVQRILLIHPSVIADSGGAFNQVSRVLPNAWRVTSSGGTFSSVNDGSTYTFTIAGTYVI